MISKNSRMMVALELPIRKWITKEAKKSGLSLSMTIRDLLRNAYENQEDRYWSAEGESRLNALKGKPSVSHKDFWGEAGL